MYDDSSVLKAIGTINDIADEIGREHDTVMAAKIREAAIILSYFRHSDLYYRRITRDEESATKQP